MLTCPTLAHYARCPIRVKQRRISVRSDRTGAWSDGGECENRRSSVDSSQPGGLEPAMRRDVVLLLLLSIVRAARVQASPEACRDAILVAAARYDQATSKVVASCQQHH